jgi:hypothetical protein
MAQYSTGSDTTKQIKKKEENMINEINETELVETANSGVKVLGKLFKTDTPAKDQIAIARLASSNLSMYARLQATKSSMLSLRVRVAQSILKTPQERKQYLKISSPELKLLK